MIRINLLPDAQRDTSSAGGNTGWAIGYLLATFAWGVLLSVVYYSYEGRLTELRAANQSLEEQIKRAKEQSKGLEGVQAKIDKSKQLAEVVGKLQTARSGPTRVMMQLSRILSVGGGPTIDQQRLADLRKENPLAGFNPGWDVRRLWLKSFEEEARECSIAGFGRSNEDVAEFLRRLSISEVFDHVMLEKTTSAKVKKSTVDVIDFRLTCKVRY